MTRHQLHLTTALAAALLAAGCNDAPAEDWTAQRDTAVCTDRDGVRVPDSNCERHASAGAGIASSAFLWYFIGRSSVLPYYGERVAGGSYTRAPGTSYYRAPAATAMTRSAAIARGGFGSSAKSYGSARS